MADTRSLAQMQAIWSQLGMTPTPEMLAQYRPAFNPFADLTAPAPAAVPTAAAVPRWASQAQPSTIVPTVVTAPAAVPVAAPVISDQSSRRPIEVIPTGVPVAPAAAVAPAPVVTPAPVAMPSTGPTIAPTPWCPTGNCGPGGGTWAAGDGTTEWDRRMDAMLNQRSGGIDAITQNDAARRRQGTADMRASPQWEEQFRAALAANRGDYAAAQAVADRAMMVATPGSSLGYAENLAAGNEQAVNNYRSQLLALAGYTSDPNVAAPAFGTTPGYSTGGIENFYAGADGSPVASIFGVQRSLPNVMESYAIGPEAARAGVGGQLTRSDAGQSNIAQLQMANAEILNPVPLQKALLTIQQDALKDPITVTPELRAIREQRIRQFARAYPTATEQDYITFLRSGATPAGVAAVAAP